MLRIGASMALDPVLGQIVMIGGGSSDTVQTADVGTFVWRGEWAQKPGLVPTARRGAALAYDEVHRQFVAYGGCVWNGSEDTALADTWVWDGVSANWEQQACGITARRALQCRPRVRRCARSARAVRRQRFLRARSRSATTWIWDGTNVEHGDARDESERARARCDGLRSSPWSDRSVRRQKHGRLTIASDTWTWDGQTWQSMSVVVHPAARNEAVMAWDASRARLVLTGGGAYPSQFVYSDTWEWDGKAWIQVAANGNARRRAAMASAPGWRRCDSVRGRGPFQSHHNDADPGICRYVAIALGRRHRLRAMHRRRHRRRWRGRLRGSRLLVGVHAALPAEHVVRDRFAGLRRWHAQHIARTLRRVSARRDGRARHAAVTSSARAASRSRAARAIAPLRCRRSAVRRHHVALMTALRA